MTLRRLETRLPAQRAVEGDGFVVHRPFPVPGTEQVDPFLLLDQMGPVDHGPGEAVGTPVHPHRGFETVTYLLEGELQHRDSLGNEGTLGPGDTQWMTAGRGVLHEEGPTSGFLARGGRLHGLQLWVNLPASAKMIPPAYQDITADAVAVSHPSPGATVRVVAGEAFDLVGPGSTHTPITYTHVTLEPGAQVASAFDPNHTVLVFPLLGVVAVGDEVLATAELGVLGPGDAVELSVPADAASPSEILVLSGRPIGEPIARHGPFVMNTREELVQAFADVRSPEFGS
ncbi:MAG: pirin family protein [Actinomycetota bacterium]